MFDKPRLNSLFICILIILSFNYSQAQSKKYISIIPPFHSRYELGSIKTPLQLSKQRFVLFVYPNAVAVYSESVFTNESDQSIEQEMALPSTGHDENGDLPGGRISNGILSVQLWIQGERINPELIHENDIDWYIIKTRFESHQKRKVKALFWAETSLSDIDSLHKKDTAYIASGKRAFLINLAHAAIWKSIIKSIDVTVVFNDGITPNPDSLKARPSDYEIKDSTLSWSMGNIEPSSDDNIFVLYNSGKISDDNMINMRKIAQFMVKTVYDKLLYYSSQLPQL